MGTKALSLSYSLPRRRRRRRGPDAKRGAGGERETERATTKPSESYSTNLAFLARPWQ